MYVAAAFMRRITGFKRYNEVSQTTPQPQLVACGRGVKYTQNIELSIICQKGHARAHYSTHKTLGSNVVIPAVVQNGLPQSTLTSDKIPANSTKRKWAGFGGGCLLVNR